MIQRHKRELNLNPAINNACLSMRGFGVSLTVLVEDGVCFVCFSAVSLNLALFMKETIFCPISI